MSQPLTVLFDGGCPLCSREINHYRKLAAEAPIRWVDVAAPDAPLAEFGVSREAALRLFHVRDGSGQLHTGVRAFMALWRQLPYYRWLECACRRLRVVPVLDWGYRRFASWHFAKRCRDGACSV